MPHVVIKNITLLLNKKYEKFWGWGNKGESRRQVVMGGGRFRTEKESSSPLWQWSLPNDFAKIL